MENHLCDMKYSYDLLIQPNVSGENMAQWLKKNKPHSIQVSYNSMRH